MQKKLNPKKIWKLIEITSSCWLWKGSKSYNGYGQLGYNNKRFEAHRFVYELLEGKIPEGLELDHLCKIRNCVNPAHLQFVTHKENIYRGNGVTAINARKTHCIRGHEFTLENTTYYTRKGGHQERKCKSCKRINSYEERQRNKKVMLIV